jgi:WD40 repeat protein
VLAYADDAGRVHVFDADTGRALGRTPSGPAVRQLAFDRSGRLIVATAKKILVYRRTVRGAPYEYASAKAGHELLNFAPNGSGLVYADYDRATDSTTLIRPVCSTSGACLLILSPNSSLFRGAGRVEGLALSPDGRWLVSGWPAADQLLFLRLVPRIGKVVAVSDATDEFSPGGAPVTFPAVAGWVQ